MPPLLVTALVSAAAFAADQGTKAWLTTVVPLNSWTKVASFFNLIHIRNQGSAFGLFSPTETGWLMTALTALGTAALIFWAIRTERTGWPGRVGLGLAIGGAAGNLLDRVRLGGVTDFLDFHAYGFHWPAFNVADAALTVGFFVLLLDWIHLGQKIVVKPAADA